MNKEIRKQLTALQQREVFPEFDRECYPTCSIPRKEPYAIASGRLAPNNGFTMIPLRHHSHNLTGKIPSSESDWTACLDLSHCPSYCDHRFICDAHKVESRLIVGLDDDWEVEEVIEYRVNGLAIVRLWGERRLQVVHNSVLKTITY